MHSAETHLAVSNDPYTLQASSRRYLRAVEVHFVKTDKGSWYLPPVYCRITQFCVEISCFQLLIRIINGGQSYGTKDS